MKGLYSGLAAGAEMIRAMYSIRKTNEDMYVMLNRNSCHSCISSKVLAMMAMMDITMKNSTVPVAILLCRKLWRRVWSLIIWCF